MEEKIRFCRCSLIDLSNQSLLFNVDWPEEGEIPAIVLFLSPGPSLPFSLFLSAVQNRDATSFSDKLKAIDSLLLTTKNQYPFHRNCINWVVLFFPQEVRRPFIILCLPMMNLLTTKTTFLRHDGKCIRQGARR